MWKIINIFQWLIIFFIMMISSFLAILALLISNKASFWVSKHIWARLLCIITFVQVEVINMNRIANEKQHVIYCANHQSLYDIIALYRVLKRPIYFIAKKELKNLPFIGWYISLAGMIFIDRSNRENAMKSLEKAGELIISGKDVITFPEGTRSNQLQRFKRGSFIIAKSSNIKIIPVGIKGSYKVNPPKSIQLRPGKIVINIGHPIDTNELAHLTPDKLANYTKGKVSELIAEIQ